MNNQTLDETINAIAALSGDVSDKLWMFVQMADDKILMDELTTQGMLAKAGLAEVSQTHAFVYGVLKLTKPHLFETEDE